MGLFGSKESSKKKVSSNEISWRKNKIRITDDGYLVTEGVINVNRIPVRHIETVTYSLNVTKDVAAPEIQLIGKGVVLGTLNVGNETKDEIQDWILEKLEL